VSGYPLLLEGTRIEALVVGGGPVAYRKAAALLESGARVRVVAPAMCDAFTERAVDCPTLVLVERAYVPQDIGSATIVIAATGVRSVNAQVASDAGRLGRLINVADAPEDGNCATVAVHRAGALVIGVSAGGAPTVAARVRDAIAARFDARFASAVGVVGAVRRRCLASERPADWLAAEQDLIGTDFCARVEDGTFPSQAARWQDESTPSPEHAWD
jgi:precorrin-2 dehydrogenase / sirohydrochlorin ferrochelatase